MAANQILVVDRLAVYVDEGEAERYSGYKMNTHVASFAFLDLPSFVTFKNVEARSLRSESGRSSGARKLISMTLVEDIFK